MTLNPPADWEETVKDSPAYIKNKPVLGTVASHDIAEQISQSQDIPTAKQVYDSLREVNQELATVKTIAGSGGPLKAEGIENMTETNRVYVYIGNESGMNWGHWYYFDGTDWADGGVYQSTAVSTDTTLLVGGKAADSAAVGNALNEVKGETEDLYEKIEDFASQLDILTTRADSFFNELDVTDSGLVYGAQDGTRLNGPYGPFAGNGSGGGGGGSYDSIDAVFSATNLTEYTTATIADGADIYFDFTWESLENDVSSGRGTVTITVNNVVRATLSVAQGENHINLKSYYSAGANKIRIRIADQYDQGKSWIVNINVVALTITSTFITSFPFDDVITVPYTPNGNVSKTIYFLVDDVVIGTNVTSASGRQLTYVLPAQSHGGHTLDIYFEAEVNGETIRSNTLHYEFIYLRAGETDPIIISQFNTSSVLQYSSIIIPYMVYNPVSSESEVDIYINDILTSTQTVDNSQQNFTYKANHAGEIEIKFTCGNAQPKIITLSVTPSEVHVEAEDEDMPLYLSALERNNNEQTRNTWVYNDIQAQMTGFNWQIDGWMTDDDGWSMLRLLDDARVYIPYKPFLNNFINTGKTFEIEFSTHNVIDYSVQIISCFANNIGFIITPQSVIFKSTQKTLEMPFKENEHIRLSIVVHKQNTDRLLLFYINGIMSSALEYQPVDNFRQGNDNVAVGISIGSNDCGVDIYSIRIYDKDLSSEQVVNNWIADTQDGGLLLERYDRNNIYDSGVINPNTLPSNMPYWILNATSLPEEKLEGEKPKITLSFTDPANPAKSFTAEGVQINVQGTSSQAYYRKNYDLQFKKGFNLTTGYSDNYTIIDAIPFNRIVLKADVASSESTNNTRLTMFYNDTCPYKTPEMVANSKVRWGIEGRPCVVFWYNPDTGVTKFLGKYNMNLPKRAPGPYGYTGNDESWEVEQNNSSNVKFQDNDFTTLKQDKKTKEWKLAWYDDWEARFPDDTWRNINKLNEFVTWVKSTWMDEATNEEFETSITYTLSTLVTVSEFSDDDSFSYTSETLENDGVYTTVYNITFTKDTPAYRLTKFRYEAPQYMEIESATFYYLFTLVFLMIDSRAKNMFFGFHGSQATGLDYITRKTVFEPYDMDTAIGTNNSGVLKFDYHYLDTDTVSSIVAGGDEGEGPKEVNVFNGQDSVLWSNFQIAFRPEYATMYQTLRGNEIWTYDVIENIYEEHQSMWPESLFNEDAYEKYIVPLVENVTLDEETGKYVKTDKYLTMLQGSKEQQRKWWLQNRFRYMDSMFNVGSASTSYIEMRLFNSGELTITSAIDIFAAVRFGRGSTTLIQRTTANTPVSFTYTVKPGATVQEMESTIFSANLITDVGDLSIFYGNEFDFSRATRIRKLKFGDSSPNYSNVNLTILNVKNCFMLQEIDCRNCSSLSVPIALDGSPLLEKAYFEGTKITGISLVEGCPITTLHLPNTITDLILLNHSKLTDFVCPTFENVSTFMFANIDQNILDPLEVLNEIKVGSRVNIQGIDVDIEVPAEDQVIEAPIYDNDWNIVDYEERTLTTDSDKAGYVIEQFLDRLKQMIGVVRAWSDSEDEWNYDDTAYAIVSGTIHATALTGAQIASYRGLDGTGRYNYPYLTFVADYISSTLTLKTWDGTSNVVDPIVCLNGSPQSTIPSTGTRASTAQYNYTFVGWSRNMDAETAQSDATTNVIEDRTVYQAFSRTVRTYTVTWKNADGTVLETDTNVPYGTRPTYNGATPTQEGNTYTGWDVDITQGITGNTVITATYRPVYTATFKLADIDGGTTLLTQRVAEGNTASYTGTTPTTSRGSTTEFTFIGFVPVFAPMYSNATYTAVFRDNRSDLLKYLTGDLTVLPWKIYYPTESNRQEENNQEDDNQEDDNQEETQGGN